MCKKLTGWHENYFTADLRQWTYFAAVNLDGSDEVVLMQTLIRWTLVCSLSLMHAKMQMLDSVGISPFWGPDVVWSVKALCVAGEVWRWLRMMWCDVVWCGVMWCEVWRRCAWQARCKGCLEWGNQLTRFVYMLDRFVEKLRCMATSSFPSRVHIWERELQLSTSRVFSVSCPAWYGEGAGKTRELATVAGLFSSIIWEQGFNKIRESSRILELLEQFDVQFQKWRVLLVSRSYPYKTCLDCLKCIYTIYNIS